MIRLLALLLLSSASLVLAACSTTSGSDYDRCICDFSVQPDLPTCEQLDRKPGDTRSLAPFCDGPTLQACEALGGEYLTDGTECPTADLVGTCHDDESDEPDTPFTKTTHYYALGDNAFDAAAAEADCEEDEVFAAP